VNAAHFYVKFPTRQTFSIPALHSKGGTPILSLGGYCPVREKTGYPGALIEPLGGCPWPEPWLWPYGPHLQTQAREDPSVHGDGGPACPIFLLHYFLRPDEHDRQIRPQAPSP
jgi:hypothetical protein